MRFAEFFPGQRITAGPYTVTREEILAFARDYDPQWFHVDEAAADQGPFGGLIASGWHTCAIAMRLIVPAALHGSESFASPGVDQVRWPNPVRPGDQLRVVAEVTDVRRSRRKETLGILRWRWKMTNQHGAEVLDVDATSLFDLGREARRPAA